MNPLSWLADTLAKRLFWLMWIALVVSHFAAWMSVNLVHGRTDVGTAIQRLPTLPSLPPMGLPSAERRPGGPPPRADENHPLPRADDGRAPPHPPQAFDGPGPGPRGMPWGAAALDYGVRFLLIALAAWLGSRWLAQPMARLVRASQQLGGTLASGRAPPQIDETSGTREVREAAQVFNRMSRQLKEQFDARGLMISAISHDLRTPLTRMRMRLETSDADAQLRERCNADIREMDALIASVLELFRGQHANAPLQRTDVGALVQSLIDDLAEQGESVGGEVASVVASADPIALKRVLSNLIGNGLRYGTRVHVAIESDDKALRVLIDDDGPGIPEAQLETVFEPFYRVEGSRSRSSGGTGLGLYIARQLTLAQGGELRLSNRMAGGLRAEVTLLR